MSSQTHEIVILGGSFAGIGSAHYLLRHTIPALTALNPKQRYHVTLVSPSTHFFWKICAPRVLISSDMIPFEKAFLPIEEEFSKYDPSQFSFLQAKATGINSGSKTVAVELADGISQRSIPYGTLIVATGAFSDPLWAVNDAHTVSQDAHRELRLALPHAKSVLVTGGGATGVETAAEVAENFLFTKTTILSGTDRLLSRLKPKASKTAETKLRKLGVNVIHGVKAVSVVKEDNGQKRVNLSNGKEMVVDVYINAVGDKPNTAFLPHEWLDARGRVLVDGETLRGQGSSMENVYALGDVCSASFGSVMDVKNGVRPLCTSIATDIAAQLANDEKHQVSGKTPKALIQVKFKPFKDTQMVPIGRRGGIFQLMGWGLPSWVCWLIKSRDFMITKAVTVVNGADYVKP